MFSIITPWLYRHQSEINDVILVSKFEHISLLLLVFLFPSLGIYLFALCDLFYISIVFRFNGVKFHPFLERISTKWMHFQGADWKQWNKKCISLKFQWWNWNLLRSHQIFSSMLKLFFSTLRCDHVWLFKNWYCFKSHLLKI